MNIFAVIYSSSFGSYLCSIDIKGYVKQQGLFHLIIFFSNTVSENQILKYYCHRSFNQINMDPFSLTVMYNSLYSQLKCRLHLPLFSLLSFSASPPSSLLLSSSSPLKSVFEGNLGSGYLKERRAAGLVFCENTSSLYRTLFVSGLDVSLHPRVVWPTVGCKSIP